MLARCRSRWTCSIARSITAAADRVIGAWGHIDVLVNNAIHTGPGSMLRFEDTTVEMIETKLAANVVSQVILLKAVLDHMSERGEGRVINVTSAVAITDPPAPPGEGGWGLAYTMSKGAFHRLAPNLTVEYPQLRFFNLEPGYVETKRARPERCRARPRRPVSRRAALGPRGRDRLARVVPDADELNGQTITAQRFAKERNLHDKWW